MTTATTMALTELAEKGADVDVLRQMYPACLLGEVVYTARSLDEIRALCP